MDSSILHWGHPNGKEERAKSADCAFAGGQRKRWEVHSMRRILVLTIISAAILCLSDRLSAEEGAKGKKLIECGWDEPDTKFIRQNIQKMEQFPFDGFVFHVVSSKGGN